MAAQRNEKAGAEGVWQCVFGGVCGREADSDSLLIENLFRRLLDDSTLHTYNLAAYNKK